MVLHRHLQTARDRFAVEFLSPPVARFSSWGACRRVAGWVAKWGHARLAEEVHARIDGRWADRWLASALNGRKNSVVMTVAHGDLAYAADRAARGAGLPLVVIFHDWWPDIPPLGQAARQREQNHFLRLHRNATASLPVSEGMRSALGSHPAARVLYPIPSVDDAANALPRGANDRPFRVLYAGNVSEYGPMVATALQESLCNPGIRFEVSGSDPKWSSTFRDAMRAGGLWLDFLPRPKLEEWFRSADAFLVPLVFDPAFRRRMETSFPSKLTEFSRYGRPLVIWGPEYGSAVRWARETEEAICVTSPRPADLMKELDRLAGDNSLREEMGHRARRAYETRFHPKLLQRVFEESVLAAVGPSGGKDAMDDTPRSRVS